ncbi:MAG: thymidine kinase [Acidimicrobiia bacterium]|nr:thymidine kinase [Acidimicrobiia bacterium]
MYRRPHTGWTEVICGPMFSGKSEELIRRVTRSKIARIPVQTFKPVLDNRYAEGEVVSHSAHRVEAIPVPDSESLLHRVEDATVVVGIDEAQFFDLGLIEVVDRLAHAGKQVIIAGLDTDYMRRPFEPVPALCGRSEYVTKMLAVCHRCGAPALYTQRIVRSDDLVVLGAEGSYEARCRACYDPSEPEQPHLGLLDQLSESADLLLP